MNREEKNQLTRKKIMDSAIAEFAAHGLEAASLNTICQNGGISKGIIYHYFSSKEDLYLVCLKECFQALTDEMRKKIKDRCEGMELLDLYFHTRLEFFRLHPTYARIFCSALIFPPTHLRSEIQEIRHHFDTMNDAYLHRILSKSRIRNNFTQEDITRSFHSFQNVLNAEFSNQSQTELNIEQHEAESRKMLDIFLYGILERN